MPEARSFNSFRVMRRHLPFCTNGLYPTRIASLQSFSAPSRSRPIGCFGIAEWFTRISEFCLKFCILGTYHARIEPQPWWGTGVDPRSCASTEEPTTAPVYLNATPRLPSPQTLPVVIRLDRFG